MRAPSGRAGGILQCIVEQVRDDFAQQHRIAAHVQCFVVAGLVAALEAEIDVRRERARHPLGAGLERHRGEVDVDETRNLFARLRASERQQLVGQPHRAIGSRAQFAHGRIGLLRIARDGRLLGMQLHRGERRAQLVRGVGDELALRVERGLQAAEQRVHRARERPDFERHVGLVDRLQRRVGLPVQRIGEMRERAELLVHDAPHDAPAGEQQQQQRHHDGDQEFGGDPVAVPHRLRDFDDHRLAALDVFDAYLGDAHRAIVVLGLEHVRVMHAAHVDAAQRQLRIAGELLFAVADPVDQRFGRIGEHRLRERRHGERRVGAGDLDLFRDGGGEIGERAVDHVLRVLPREPVGDQAAHQREHRQRRGEAPQQRAAQAGGHGRISRHFDGQMDERRSRGAARSGTGRRRATGNGAVRRTGRRRPAGAPAAQTLAVWRISCSR
jgi:hypothetical protein